MNRSRRNRLVHLLALAALAAGVPLAIDATPAGAAAGACGASYDKVWTGATGDGLWDTAANWTDGQGNPGVPGPASNVCIDTGAGGAVRAANGLSVGRLSLAGGPSDPAVDVSGLILVTSAIGGESRLVLSGEATLTAVHVEVDLTVASGADVAVKAGFGQQRHDALDVSGTLHLQKSARLWETIVRDGGRIDTVGTVGGDLVLAGDLDIRPGGAFVVTGRSASGGLINVAVLRGSRLLGGTPHLADVGIAHAGPHALTVTGDVVVRRVDAGSSLTVRPEGDRMSLLPLEGSQVDLTRNDGTLDIAGVPASSPSSLPRGDIDVAILNTGTLRLDGVQLNHGLRNEGTTSVQRFVWLKSDQTLDNRGRLEIGPWLGQGIIGASLLSSGTVANSGTIVSTDPTAMISAERYEGSGTIDTWLGLISDDAVDGWQVAPGRRRAVPVLGLAPSKVGLELGGLTDATASRVAVTKALVDFGSPIELNASITPGYVPCAGARWQLVSWPKLLVGYRPPTANPSGNIPGVTRSTPKLVTPGVPAGVQVVLRERADGWVAVVKGSPTAGASCSDPVGRRLVSGWFVDGLGRPATDAQLASFGDRSTTATGRRAVAKELLGGQAAVGRFVTTDLARILGRPASAGGVAAYVQRLRTGTEPDVMRAETYGGSGFWVSSGSTADGWTTALYRTELGRAPTAAELTWRRRQIAAGTSRGIIARNLLNGGEADRALAGRAMVLWWGRGSSYSEHVTWGARYRSGPEPVATADLAAANPIT